MSTFARAIESATWVAVGTLPPPVTGMTLLTEKVLERLQAAGSVRVLNWSSGLAKKGLRFRLARLRRVFRSYRELLRLGRVERGQLYLVANSNAGLYLTALFVATARGLGYRVYLHHHVYSYIDRHDWRMAWIVRRMGSDGVHIVHGEKMIADFCRQYATAAGFELILPSVVTAPAMPPRSSPHRPFRLGHLSNLTMPKGLDLVIDTFERLFHAGRDVRLELAGPVQRGRPRRLLDQLLERHPERVRYHGPLYGPNKESFYAQIDAFILPTRSESWGIVLHEAMCAAVPVITFDRGCTTIVVGDTGGVLVDPSDDFAKKASERLICWMDSNEDYAAASRAAVEHAVYLQNEGRRSLDEFASRWGAAGKTFDNRGPDIRGAAKNGLSGVH